jgi:hypothetical protein
MGDRPGSPSWVRTSEDKVCRKDLCGFVRTGYLLEKLPDVSGSSLVEAECYKETFHFFNISDRRLCTNKLEVSAPK